jgi:hypothetical protein
LRRIFNRKQSEVYVLSFTYPHSHYYASHLITPALTPHPSSHSLLIPHPHPSLLLAILSTHPLLLLALFHCYSFTLSHSVTHSLTHSLHTHSTLTLHSLIPLTHSSHSLTHSLSSLLTALSHGNIRRVHHRKSLFLGQNLAGILGSLYMSLQRTTSKCSCKLSFL